MPTMASSYVKFLRGTTAQYNNLASYDSNTLYFVTDSIDAVVGRLYLGNVLIAGGTGSSSGSNLPISLGEISNILINNPLLDHQVLAYDAANAKWTNIDLASLISVPSVMIGATTTQNGVSGLVPSSTAGDINRFLRVDGTWATVPTISNETVANLNAQINQLQNIVINGFVNENEEHVESLITQVGTLQATVTNLVTTVSSLDLTAINNRVATLENVINDTTIEVNGETITQLGLATKVGNLSALLDTHEERIVQLEDLLTWQPINQ